ncbi:MAG TPA: phage tail tape measure protein, partial [Hyphomicrobiales bacterium]|nr:phage tail tape measure protein [Hyphomicrobiales bacterium]
MTDTVASLSVRIGADTTEARQKLKDLESLGDSFGRRMSGAFERAIFTGDSFGDTLRKLAIDLSRLALRSALSPITSALGNGLAGLIGGVTPFA